MDNQDLLKYCNSRIKTYTFHKMNLKDCKDIKSFEHHRDELFSDIFDDNQMLLDIETSGKPVIKPVVEAFASLNSYSSTILDFYAKYKVLMNY